MSTPASYQSGTQRKSLLVVALQASIAVALGCLAACGGGGTASAPTGQVQTPFSAPPATQQLEGRVFDAISGPVAGAFVYLYVQLPDGSGYSSNYASGGVTAQTGADGRFSVLVPPEASVVVDATKEGYVQPCAAIVDTKAMGSVDVELVALTTLDVWNPPPPQSAASAITTSGTVYELVGGNRQPIAGAMLWFSVIGDISVATTVSDRDGHYIACNLGHSGIGVLSAGAGPELLVQAAGYANADIFPIDTSRSAVIDVHMQRR